MLHSRHMLLLARWTLVLGFFSLMLASWKLYNRAFAAPDLAISHLAWMLPLAILGGWFKARKVMRRRMQANALRLVQASGKLWPWQLYPPALFLFIGFMIFSMIVLKRSFAHDPFVLAILGSVDLAVAIALLTSSWEYSSRLFEDLNANQPVESVLPPPSA